MIYNTSQTNNQEHINNNSQINNTNSEQQNIKIYFSIPYIKEINNKIIKLFRFDPKIKITQKHVKTINSIFSKLKDKDEPLKMSEVVYSIPCTQCDKVYIGQTSRVLKDRITNHKSDCRLNKNTSTLAQHYLSFNHYFDYNNTKILQNENNYFKRSFLEMVEISLEPRAINKKSDIDDLSIIYTNILQLSTTHQSNLTNNSQTSTLL